MNVIEGINLDSIDELYRLFGFRKLKSSENIRVYEYLHGYFRNIEIFLVSNINKDYEDIKNDYEKSGIFCDNCF